MAYWSSISFVVIGVQQHTYSLAAAWMRARARQPSARGRSAERVSHAHGTPRRLLHSNPGLTPLTVAANGNFPVPFRGAGPFPFSRFHRRSEFMRYEVMSPYETL